MNDYESIKDIDSLNRALERVKTAQITFSEYTQEQVDKIFYAASLAASKARIHLAELAVLETGMGVVEDKVIKNHLASEFIYNKYKNEKTCGTIEINESQGIEKIACPIGVIGALIPVTNPTSTAIFKILIALKTRNGIILSPHPRAKGCTKEATDIILEAAISAGAPRDIIKCIDKPSMELTATLMRGVDMILATGGTQMVKSAYSSGKPALGVGAGNTPAIIDSSADIRLSVSSVIHSKTFDNGMICASEQAVIALDDIYDAVKDEFEAQGCRFLDNEEIARLRIVMFPNDAINPDIVGKSATEIARLAKIELQSNAKILIAEVESTEKEECFSMEKLSPILAIYRARDFDDAIEKAESLVEHGGPGHTASIFLNERTQREKLDKFKNKMRACRILVNTPSAQGGVGDIYNFALPPSLTLGCGSWGGNSVCENVGVKHLVNVKNVAIRRENMLWLRVPEKIYFKSGCLSYALKEIAEASHNKRAFIVTDNFLFKSGYSDVITENLKELGTRCSLFSGVVSNPTLSCVLEGVSQIRSFEPDVIVAFGGGSVIDAAKIMWVMYEHPTSEFEDMSVRFCDIRKKIYKFPQMGEKAYFVAIPTSAGTGSEVTPFSVITDQKNGVKYPIADYELLPDMAIIDPNLHISAPKELTRDSGIDALVHAIEAYASVMANDFTDAMALHAIKLICEFLPRAYKDGEDAFAREKMANAATMAGIAFANSFLGVCHSMAHKLGSFYHLSHGLSNALLIEQVIKFNANDTPEKMGTFSQYAYPNANEKYAKIAKSIGISSEKPAEMADKLVEYIKKLKKELDIKGSIQEYGIDEKDFLNSVEEMSKMAFDDQCTTSNPRYPLISEIKNMYLDAYYGK